jgi:hypothetical protein
MSGIFGRNGNFKLYEPENDFGNYKKETHLEAPLFNDWSIIRVHFTVVKTKCKQDSDSGKLSCYYFIEVFWFGKELGKFSHPSSNRIHLTALCLKNCRPSMGGEG